MPLREELKEQSLSELKKRYSTLIKEDPCKIKLLENINGLVAEYDSLLLSDQKSEAVNKIIEDELSKVPANSSDSKIQNIANGIYYKIINQWNLEWEERILKTLETYYRDILTSHNIDLLKVINQLALKNNVRLDQTQSREVIEIIGRGLQNPFDYSSIEAIAADIYSKVIEQMDREKQENQHLHKSAGHFDTPYIHQRALRDELQDHDMTLLMPKSSGNIVVLGSINRFDERSISVIQDSISDNLQNKDIDHIIIPIGPGHWRGVYLTKPSTNKDKYHLELFDPYGKASAQGVEDFVLNVLKGCGINKDQIEIKLTGPTHLQQDAYACGDFTCAYSHQKMKAFKAPEIAYNQGLIDVLVNKGNQGDALRWESRTVAAALKNSKDILTKPKEGFSVNDSMNSGAKQRYQPPNKAPSVRVPPPKKESPILKDRKNRLNNVAKWPPQSKNGQLNRYYYDLEGKVISCNLKGKDGHAVAYVKKQKFLSKEQKQEQLSSIKLFSNLPSIFFEKYLYAQNGPQPFKLPTIQRDKTLTVRQAIETHPLFKEGEFHPSQWKSLGWKNQEEYEKWLDTSVRFAFSGSLHYCSVDRIFDCTKKVDGKDHFHQVSTKMPKKTNILSVAAFEYRDGRHWSSVTVDQRHLQEVEHYSKGIMASILEAAEETKTTDIVLIPYGMGVFIRNHPKEQEIKKALLDGMVEALRSYDGPPVTIHCCGDPNFYNALQLAGNQKIILEKKVGCDALTVANSIEDDPTKPKKKSMLINAGDDDWKVLLNKEMTPGQFAAGHTLYSETSDEYFALVTDFAFYSIQNLISAFEDIKKYICKTPKKREPKFQENEKYEFLTELGNVFADFNKLDEAVLDNEVASLETFSSEEFAVTKKYLSLMELDAYEVFNQDGSLNEEIAAQYGIKIDEEKLKQTSRLDGFENLSLREMIIFNSAIIRAQNNLKKSNAYEEQMKLLNEKYKNLSDQLVSSPNNGKLIVEQKKIMRDLERISSYGSNDMIEECFAELSQRFKLTNPLSMNLVDAAKPILGMGYANEPNTNIAVSEGPRSARSITPHDEPELYEARDDIARYLNNLLVGDVVHIFAMGRVFPYYPQDDISHNKILEQDFINYFIPGADGIVMLPDIPELKDIHITSHPIKKVGRFITYEISINGNNPIQVHHCPIRDKQPLELTPEELAYVKEIAKKTSPEKNIHAHFREEKEHSAQIDYLLASLIPQYGQLNQEEQLTPMRVGKTTSEDSMSFIETHFQENYPEGDTRHSINDDIVSDASLKDESIELYITYGALLKQEIDRHIQQIGMPVRKVDKAENRALMELMEKYQELSLVPPHQLKDWVAAVCDNKIVAEKTKALLDAINLQASNESYQIVLEKIAHIKMKTSQEIEDRKNKHEITKEQAQIEMSKLEKYESLLISHVQDAYLRNWIEVDIEDKLACKVETITNISNTIERILNEVINHNPKKPTKEDFESLQKEYSQCKQRIELLEKAEADENNVLDEQLKQLNELAEQIFILGYENFEAPLNPDDVIAKIELLNNQLIKLDSDKGLTPEKWDELKKQFTALKTLFDGTNSEKMEVPPILLDLDVLFIRGTELTKKIESLFKDEVLQNGENLDNFVAGLGMAILDATLEKLPKKYFSEKSDGIFAKGINELLDAIANLSDTYTKKGVIDLKQTGKVPTQVEYEKARQQVFELIQKHTPFFISSTYLRGLEKLTKDSSHLIDEKEPNLKKLSELKEKYKESIENVTHIKEMRTDHKNAHVKKIKKEMKYLGLDIDRKQREWNNSLIGIETSGPSQYPNPPKLIVYNVKGSLRDFSNDEKRFNDLISIIKHAGKKGFKVIIAHDSPTDSSKDFHNSDELQKLIELEEDKKEVDVQLKIKGTLKITQETKKHFEFFKFSGVRQKRKSEISQYLQEQVANLEQKIKDKQDEGLEKEIQSYEETISRLNSDTIIKLDYIKKDFAIDEEQDILFLDERQSRINEVSQNSDYRAVKISNPEEDSLRGMVDFKYAVGEYNRVINYLKADNKDDTKPTSVDLKSIYDFETYEFQHSPIVLQIGMSTIIERLGCFNSDKSVQKRYKEQFFKAAFHRYEELPEYLKNDFISAYYNEMAEGLQTINERLRTFIQNPDQNQKLFRDTLLELDSQVEEIILKDANFSQKISSPTFLSAEAKLYKSMIEEAIRTGNFNDLAVNVNNKVEFQEGHEKKRKVCYVRSIEQSPDIYQNKIHPAFIHAVSQTLSLIPEAQKTCKTLVDDSLNEIKNFQILKDIQITGGNINSLQDLLNFLKDLNFELNTTDGKSLIDYYQKLTDIKKLISNSIEKIIPYQHLLEDLQKQDRIGYKKEIDTILGKIRDYKGKIESSEEYKAKLFLDRMEQKLLAKDWNVKYRWKAYTVKDADGKDKVVTKTVAKQLAIIQNARDKGDYVNAKNELIRVGKTKEISWGSSKETINYWSLFKPKDNDDKTIERNLEEKMMAPKKSTP